jgi:hypothetical protein
VFEDGQCCGDSCWRVVVRPTGTDCVSGLWDPYPGRWAGTVESVVELLEDLVDALGCDTESLPCFVFGESFPFE